MTGPPLDPVRGAEVARELKERGVTGVLITAAELGYITELRCGMPECFCPEELGGATYFAPRTGTWNDWEPTHEHFPTAKRDGGHRTVENTVLAHRLCNKLDFPKSKGWSIEKDLARVELARAAAAELRRLEREGLPPTPEATSPSEPVPPDPPPAGGQRPG